MIFASSEESRTNSRYENNYGSRDSLNYFCLCLESKTAYSAHSWNHNYVHIGVFPSVLHIKMGCKRVSVRSVIHLRRIACNRNPTLSLLPHVFKRLWLLYLSIFFPFLVACTLVRLLGGRSFFWEVTTSKWKLLPPFASCLSHPPSSHPLKTSAPV